MTVNFNTMQTVARYSQMANKNNKNNVNFGSTSQIKQLGSDEMIKAVKKYCEENENAPNMLQTLIKTLQGDNNRPVNVQKAENEDCVPEMLQNITNHFNLTQRK